MKIENMVHHIDSLQGNWAANLEEINIPTSLIDGLREREEMYWQQRSRVRWHRGDANTTYFHRSILQQMQQNKVGKIKDGDDVWVEGTQQVANLVENHFKTLFTSKGHRE